MSCNMQMGQKFLPSIMFVLLPIPNYSRPTLLIMLLVLVAVHFPFDAFDIHCFVPVPMIQDYFMHIWCSQESLDLGRLVFSHFSLISSFMLSNVDVSFGYIALWLSARSKYFFGLDQACKISVIRVNNGTGNFCLFCLIEVSILRKCFSYILLLLTVVHCQSRGCCVHISNW